MFPTLIPSRDLGLVNDRPPSVETKDSWYGKKCKAAPLTVAWFQWAMSVIPGQRFQRRILTPPGA
jgi:hypothetical protein